MHNQTETHTMTTKGITLTILTLGLSLMVNGYIVGVIFGQNEYYETTGYVVGIGGAVCFLYGVFLFFRFVMKGVSTITAKLGISNILITCIGLISLLYFMSRMFKSCG